jgi:hypothetical protein
VLSPLVGFAFLFRQERSPLGASIAFHPTLQFGVALGYAF